MASVLSEGKRQFRYEETDSLKKKTQSWSDYDFVNLLSFVTCLWNSKLGQKYLLKKKNSL